MNWDLVLEALMAEVAANVTIAAIVGTRVVMAAEGTNYVVPGVELTLIGDRVTELWEPISVQFDVFAKNPEDVRTIERVLRTRYHTQLPITLGTLNVWAHYSDGTNLAAPSRDEFFARALRFTFTPLRAAYTGS